MSKWCHGPKGALGLFLWTSLLCAEVLSRVMRHIRDEKCVRSSFATHATYETEPIQRKNLCQAGQYATLNRARHV